MDIKTKIKSLIKEADLYRSQGLLAESKGIYENVLNIIQTRLSPQDGEKISRAISAKILVLEKEIVRVEKKVLSPDMSKQSQDLITKMFKPEEGEDQNKAALEGAKALIKFGQFDRAKEELQKLIPINALRSEAAKHVLNCFFLETKYDDALNEYKNWCSDNQFSPEQLDALENFIQNTFKAKGIKKEIPKRDLAGEGISFDPEKFEAEAKSDAIASPKPSDPPGIKKPILFDEEEDEDFEEFDIMASIKKSKKKKND